MADFETKLRWLSQRGNPVGAEELIERIEARMAGDPLVVVARRREGQGMTKTQESRPDQRLSRAPGPAWAAVALLAVLGVAAALFVALGGDDADRVATQLPPTTFVPDVLTTLIAGETTPAPDGGLDVIEAAVAAFYSGEAERAAELFDLTDRTDDEIRAESAYQAAIGGRLTLLYCTEQVTAGEFTCRTPYHNALTDALDYFDSGDFNRVVVEDGVITRFGFPEHTWIVLEIGTFLAIEGGFDGYEECAFGPFPEWCATIQLENLDAWTEWRQTFEPATAVEGALRTWYGGDCAPALFLGGALDGAIDDCASPADAPASSPVHITEYESILGAEITVDGCEVLASGDSTHLSCQVSYASAMNDAVGVPPAVMTREFSVWTYGIFNDPEEGHWWQDHYPEDADLRDSFRRFAEEGELAARYAGEDCATARTAACARLIMDNLDDWAAWYRTQG